MTEILWEAPKTWAWARIDEVGEVVSGATPSTKVSEYWGNDVIWFSPADLTGYRAKFIAKGAKSISLKGLSNSSARVFPAGSVMFSSRAPVGYVAINMHEASTNQGFKTLVPNAGVFNEYVYYYFKAIRHIAEQRATGTTFKELSGSAFSALPIVLPPTNEQRRIVEKIEAMFERIDKGVENLRGAKATLALYRQSLLKSAFEGNLTADWRAQNAGALETPKTLLARIQKERETRYKSALDDWQTALAEWRAGGELGRKPGKPGRPPEIIGEAVFPSGKVAQVPTSWRWSPMSDVGRTSGGLTKNQKRESLARKAKYLRVANIYSNELRLDHISEIGVTDEEFSKSRLEKGDLLFVEGNGSLEQIGRVAVWDGSIPDITHQNHLIRFSPDGLLDSQFAMLFMISPVGRNLIKAQASSTSGLHTLSISKIANLPVPICSPAEQAEITRILDTRLTAADRMEVEIDAALTRADALRQSILKRAFAGKLVPQDPTDEPAPTLLARIKAERAKAGKTAKRKTTHAS
ncbi:restriction endonuclease subunit S [Gemmobacter caeruleus]|uniref:restriction endonuclease subunit S n=1 Tax=Gemmobacter caeruleus TaxID=2595004 RepID=UPI0011F02F6A|nr:restriction endonuclease subunit S [Gemmobacter caeruleus]